MVGTAEWARQSASLGRWEVVAPAPGRAACFPFGAVGNKSFVRLLSDPDRRCQVCGRASVLAVAHDGAARETMGRRAPSASDVRAPDYGTAGRILRFQCVEYRRLLLSLLCPRASA